MKTLKISLTELSKISKRDLDDRVQARMRNINRDKKAYAAEQFAENLMG